MRIFSRRATVITALSRPAERRKYSGAGQAGKKAAEQKNKYDITPLVTVK